MDKPYRTWLGTLDHVIDMLAEQNEYELASVLMDVRNEVAAQRVAKITQDRQDIENWTNG